MSSQFVARIPLQSGHRFFGTDALTASPRGKRWVLGVIWVLAFFAYLRVLGNAFV